MNYLSVNIRYLRKLNLLTQQDLADKIHLKRSLIGAYEEGRAVPKIPVLQEFASLFGITVDQLIGSDLEKGKGAKTTNGQSLQILSVAVNPSGEELIPIVPVKASAGYLSGYADPEYIENLPVFSMPIPELGPGKTYRVFQIKGDSMLPVPPGAYLFCEFTQKASEVKDGEPYVLVTKDDGLVYKRVYLENGDRLLLKSDNPEYDPYHVNGKSVLEMWRARGVLSFDLPKPHRNEMNHISEVLGEVKEELRKLRGKEGGD